MPVGGFDGRSRPQFRGGVVDESEQFTIDLLQEFLEQKFPTFAVLKTGVKTNPVHYF